jgi:nitroreductase
MNEVIKNIKERRSIRKYLSKQLDDNYLIEILEAGLYAPNAGGRQAPLIVVSQNQEVNEKLGKINCKVFYDNLPKNAKLGVSIDQPSIADDRNIKNAFYEAPTVLTLFSPNNYQYVEGDCAVVAQNIIIAAHSLGIGSCIIGRANKTFESNYGKLVLKEWEIDDNYIPAYHITLGYYDCKTPKDKERKLGRIKRFY